MMFAKLSYLNNEMYLTLPTLFNADVDDQTKDNWHWGGILLIILFHILTDLNRLENIKINL